MKRIYTMVFTISILLNRPCAESMIFDKYGSDGNEVSKNQRNEYIVCDGNSKMKRGAVGEIGEIERPEGRGVKGEEDVKFINGDGTKENPYEIMEVYTIREFAKAVIAGNSFSGKYIKIGEGARLNFRASSEGDGQYLPIGTKDKPFNGSFDGNGVKFEGIKMSEDESNESGLFGCIGSEGEVKNIKIQDGIFYGKEYAGCVVGKNYGTVEHCLVTGSVSCKGDLGGISGINYGTIRYCGSLAKLEGASDSSKIGSIAGMNRKDIENCYSAGSGVPCAITGDNSGKINNCFYEIEETNGISNKGIKDGGGVGLDIFGMTGKRAVINMKGFDFGEKWTVREDSEPDSLGNYLVYYPELREGKALRSQKSVRIPEISSYISVKITCNDMAVGKTLNADILLINPSRPNDTGACKFQWYRESEKIDGAVFNSYQITKDDLEHTLSVTVESENYPGIITDTLKVKNVSDSDVPNSQDKAPDSKVNSGGLIHEDNQAYLGEFTSTSDQDMLVPVTSAFAGILLGSMTVMYLRKRDNLST